MMVGDYGMRVGNEWHMTRMDLNAPSLKLFINHGTEPNVDAVTDDAEDWIEAVRDIAAGEELCRDYRTDVADEIFEGR